MIFDLTDSLCSQILFAMENQQKDFVLDARTKKVIECDHSEVDQENIYLLPVWTSSDGYNLLESFVASYKGVEPYEHLAGILAEGRGVFKNFKNTLKMYPEIERRFHSFKNKKMKFLIYEWYNALRESWGLESLEQDFYEYDDLILEDFTFRAFDCTLDSVDAANLASAFFEELKEKFFGKLGFALSKQSEALFNFINQGLKNESVKGFVCHTLSDEFAGCLLYSSDLSSTQESVFLTGLFVKQNYRGLGIARELLKRCISSLSENGIQFFIIDNSFVPKVLKPMLEKMGFREEDFAFVYELK